MSVNSTAHKKKYYEDAVKFSSLFPNKGEITWPFWDRAPIGGSRLAPMLEVHVSEQPRLIYLLVVTDF